MKNIGDFNEYFFRKQFERCYLGTFNIWGMYYNDYKGVTIVGDSELCNNIHLACHAELKNNEWIIVWELTDGQKNGRREILEKERYSEYLSEQEEWTVSNLTLFISKTIKENTIRERWE